MFAGDIYQDQLTQTICLAGWVLEQNFGNLQPKFPVSGLQESLYTTDPPKVMCLGATLI